MSIPLSRSFKLAGEAVCHDQPAQVHGAYNSGIEAADWIVDSIKADGIANDGNHRDIVIAGTLSTIYIFQLLIIIRGWHEWNFLCTCSHEVSCCQ